MIPRWTAEMVSYRYRLQPRLEDRRQIMRITTSNTSLEIYYLQRLIFIAAFYLILLQKNLILLIFKHNMKINIYTNLWRSIVDSIFFFVKYIILKIFEQCHWTYFVRKWYLSTIQWKVSLKVYYNNVNNNMIYSYVFVYIFFLLYYNKLFKMVPILNV